MCGHSEISRLQSEFSNAGFSLSEWLNAWADGGDVTITAIGNVHLGQPAPGRWLSHVELDQFVDWLRVQPPWRG